MKEKSKANEFWQTPRGKAIKKLIIWFVFFIILFIMLSLEIPIHQNQENNEQTNQKLEQFALYADMLRELENNNYAYHYTISIGDKTFILEGQKDGTNDVGTIESNDYMYKYLINTEGIFKINLQKKEPIPTLDELIDSKVINIPTLLERVKNINYRVEKNIDTRQIIYDINEYSLIVTTDLYHITKIEYKMGIDTYNLEFNQLGEIKELELNM